MKIAFTLSLLLIINHFNLLAGTWESLNAPELYGGVVYNIVEDNSGKMFCTEASSPFGAGVYRSIDAAGSWTKVLECQNPLAMAIDSSGRVYVGEYSNLPVAKGIWMSSDGGDTWQSSNEGMKSLRIRSLACDKENNVYASTRDGFYISSNGGQSWDSINTGIPEGSSERMGRSIISTSNGLFGALSNKIYHSSNKGVNWTYQGELTYLGGPTIVFSMVMSASGLLVCTTYDYLYTSSDQGITWNEVNIKDIPNIPEDWYFNIQFGGTAISPDGSIIVGTNLGILTSQDDGISWQIKDINKSFPANTTVCFHFSPDKNIYSGCLGNGIYKSSDLTNWTQTCQGIRYGYYSNFVGNYGVYIVNSNNGWYKCKNHSWKKLNMKLGNYDFIPGAPIIENSSFYYSYFNDGSLEMVIMSDDWCENWKKVFLVPVDETFIKIANGFDNEILIVTSPQNDPFTYNFYSYDRIENKYSLVTSLSAKGTEELAFTEALSLAKMPGGNLLFSVNHNGNYTKFLYKFDVALNEWFPLSSAEEGKRLIFSTFYYDMKEAGVFALPSPESDPEYLNSLFFSEDEGISWEEQKTPNERYVTGLAEVFEIPVQSINPTGFVFFASGDKIYGINQFSDPGECYEFTHDGLPDNSDIVEFTNIELLLTAVTKEGIYQYDMGTPVNEIQAPETKIYPQPANDKVLIDLGEGLYFAFKIYDLKGNLIISSQIEQNQQKLNLDTSELNPGVYQVVLVGRDGIRSEQIRIVR